MGGSNPILVVTCTITTIAKNIQGLGDLELGDSYLNLQSRQNHAVCAVLTSLGLLFCLFLRSRYRICRDLRAQEALCMLMHGLGFTV